MPNDGVIALYESDETLADFWTLRLQTRSATQTE